MISPSLLRLAFIFNVIKYLYAEANNECNPNVVISTSIEQTGFHRLMIIDMSTDGLTLDEDVIIKFNFPSSLYVDQYELDSLKNQDKDSFEYDLDTKTNVELPEYKSFPFNLIIKTTLIMGVERRMNFPFHTRYHKPNICSKTQNWVKIILNNPEIYKKVPKKCHCDKVLNHRGSIWCQINYKLMQESTVIHLPVGCLEHTPFVGLITAVIMMLGCFYLGNKILKK